MSIARCSRFSGGCCRAGGRLATTVIHFNALDPRPERYQRYPLFYSRGTDQFNMSVLFRGGGAFYPVRGQFEACARGTFKLTREVDGTTDYRLTSEEWMRRLWMRRPAFLAGLKRLARIVRAPHVAILYLYANRAWCWQFEGDPAPTVLLRQTWEAG